MEFFLHQINKSAFQLKVVGWPQGFHWMYIINLTKLKQANNVCNLVSCLNLGHNGLTTNIRNARSAFIASDARYSYLCNRLHKSEEQEFSKDRWTNQNPLYLGEIRIVQCKLQELRPRIKLYNLLVKAYVLIKKKKVAKTIQLALIL